jgi:hypothetical protein
MQDNKFRIIDKTKPSQKLKGEECTSPTYQRLTELLYRLKLNPSDFEIDLVKQIPKDEEGMKKFLQKEKEFDTDNMSKAEIVSATKWVATGLKKYGLCKYIQQYFDANKLLYRLIQ